ncbi:MAG: VWA domain-containing protein [Elusimicrobia bacterium]|nr:VWA domain-containing protein [Elusimicrobiota bacterium]
MFLTLALFLICGMSFVFPQAKNKNIEIILDASVSMNGEINDDKKIDIARKTILKILSDISPSTSSYFRIGLRTFGEEKDIDYKKDSQLLIPLEELNLKEFEYKLNNIIPSGYSPIAYSLLMASYDFPIGGNNMIILITDGRESGGGDPVVVAKQLRNEGFNIVINVIGYAVGKEDEQMLKEIAVVSSGTYSAVNNSKTLEENIRGIIGYENLMEKPKERIKLKQDTWESKEPFSAMEYSLFFPGLGQIYTDRPIKGIIDFVSEWMLIGFNYNITQIHEYKSNPLASFPKDFLDFSCLSFYLSSSIGAYLYAENRNNKEHWEMKSPEGAFLRSVVLPGWGQLYIGDNPEAGLSYICWTGFFYYKLVNPIPGGINGDSSDRKNIRTDCRNILRLIYGLQMLTFISAEMHNNEAVEYQRFAKNNYDIYFGSLRNTNFVPALFVRRTF